MFGFNVKIWCALNLWRGRFFWISAITTFTWFSIEVKSKPYEMRTLLLNNNNSCRIWQKIWLPGKIGMFTNCVTKPPDGNSIFYNWEKPLASQNWKIMALRDWIDQNPSIFALVRVCRVCLAKKTNFSFWRVLVTVQGIGIF